MNLKGIRLLIPFVVLSVSTFANPNRIILANQCSVDEIKTLIIPDNSWVNFPSYYDREEWNNVEAKVQKIVIQKGEVAKNQNIESISGFEYLQFKQGKIADDISVKLTKRKERLESLVMAELMDGNGRFLDYIVDATWELCALSSWVSPVGQYLQTGEFGLPSSDGLIVDEYAGEIAGVLSWTLFFFEEEFNKIDPQIGKWVKKSVKEKFLDPCDARNDLFWMCYRTDDSNYRTPWVSYNWLLSNLLLENNIKVRNEAVYKVFECLDHYQLHFPEDGACSGGPEIWKNSVAKYFECLELLDLVSGGEIYMFENDHLQKMGKYISDTHIGGDFFLNYASCPPNLDMPAGLIYRFGEKVGDDGLMSFGGQLASEYTKKGKVPDSDLFSRLNYVLDYDVIEADKGVYAPKDFAFENSQIVGARSVARTGEGYFVGIKGGHNNEVHNQNDAGNFVLYYNGSPFIVDPGAISMTADMLGRSRYDKWINQSSYHNLPTINGFMQAAGENYRTINFKHNASDEGLVVSMQLETAFAQKADVKKWTRTYNFNRSSGLEIQDNFSLYTIKGETYVSFMSYVEPEKIGGDLVFNVGNEKLKLVYNSKLFNIEVETVKTSDDVLLSSWGKDIYRIILKPKSKTKSGNWKYAFHAL